MQRKQLTYRVVVETTIIASAADRARITIQEVQLMCDTEVNGTRLSAVLISPGNANPQNGGYSLSHGIVAGARRKGDM